MTDREKLEKLIKCFEEVLAVVAGCCDCIGQRTEFEETVDKTLEECRPDA